MHVILEMSEADAVFFASFGCIAIVLPQGWGTEKILLMPLAYNVYLNISMALLFSWMLAYLFWFVILLYQPR